MKEKLLNNLGLKILSIVLAFVVWLSVVNIANPDVLQTQEIPIEVLNGDVLEAAKLTYEMEGKQTVTVSYKVKTRDAYLIKKADFRAYIDLADYNVTGAVPVTVEVNSENEGLVSSVTAKPSVIKITTEELQRKKFDLQLATTGTMEDGYALGTPLLSPNYVYVKGPESKIGQINHVGIEVDVENANSDISGTTTPVFYDANGNKLNLGDAVTIVNSNEINFDIVVLKAKNLALDYLVKGEVSEGYRFTGTESSTKSIAVVGMKSVLASVTTLTIDDALLTVEGAVTDRTITIDLSKYLPQGVTLADETAGEVTVILKVEPLITQVVELDIDDIVMNGASEDYKYKFDTSHIKVSVKGLQEDLDSLTGVDLNAVIDVSAMVPGTYSGQLSFKTSEGFKVESYSDFEIEVSDVNQPSHNSEDEQSQIEPASESEAQPED